MSDTIAVEKVVSALLEPAVAAVPAVAADLADALDAVLGDEALAASIDADLARIREKIPTGGRPLVETDRTAILAAARALLLDRLGSR